MWLDSNLPEDIVAQLQNHEVLADVACLELRYSDAVEELSKAFRLLPSPPHQWVAASWLLISIGDAAYLAGDPHTASEALSEVTREGRGWETSPICWLRRGQIALDHDDERKASNCLASAFMLAGYDIFSNEDEKYAKFVLGQMDSPVPPVDHPLARFHRDRIHAVPRPWWKFW